MKKEIIPEPGFRTLSYVATYMSLNEKWLYDACSYNLNCKKMPMMIDPRDFKRITNRNVIIRFQPHNHNDGMKYPRFVRREVILKIDRRLKLSDQVIKDTENKIKES